MKRDGGKRRQEETTGERTAGADGGSYGRGSGGSGLRWLGRQHFVRMVEAARAVAPRRAKVIRRRRLGRRRLGRWHPRSGVAPAGRTARPLSARAGAWLGVASGAAHRGGAVVAVVLGVAVIVQQRPQLHFVKRGSGAPCRFQATEGASRPSQIQTAAVKIICSNSLLWTAFASATCRCLSCTREQGRASGMRLTSAAFFSMLDRRHLLLQHTNRLARQFTWKLAGTPLVQVSQVCTPN